MKKWVIPGGRIPLEFGSTDCLSFLNQGQTEVISFYIYHSDKDPSGPYQVEVKENKVCKINLENIIDPEALLLDEPYSVVIETSDNVIVQFSRRQVARAALIGGIAYPQE